MFDQALYKNWLKLCQYYRKYYKNKKKLCDNIIVNILQLDWMVYVVKLQKKYT